MSKYTEEQVATFSDLILNQGMAAVKAAEIVGINRNTATSMARRIRAKAKQAKRTALVTKQGTVQDERIACAMEDIAMSLRALVKIAKHIASNSDPPRSTQVQQPQANNGHVAHPDPELRSEIAAILAEEEERERQQALADIRADERADASAWATNLLWGKTETE